MRHRVAHRKLNRTMSHRKSLRRNLAQSLIEHGQIRTTITKAKDVRPFVERLITLAVQVRNRAASSDAAGSLVARRQIHKLLSDRSIVPADSQGEYNDMSDAHRRDALRARSGRRYISGEPKGRLSFTGETVSHRLIEKVAALYQDRPGGYTRIIRLADRRVGDHTQLAILQLVGDEEAPGSLAKPRKSARRRRTDNRYSAAIKTARGSRTKPAAVATQDAADDGAGDEQSSD